MATRRVSSSASSSASESEVTSSRARGVSETSRDTVQTGSRLRIGSPTNTIDGTSLADTTTLRSGSPTAVSRTTFDTASIVTTTTQKQPTIAGGIPIIRPPVLQQQGAGTGLGHFGPQRPAGYPTQPPTAAVAGVNQQQIKIDVAAAQQQYHQRTVQQEISPYSGSSISSSGGSLSSPGAASIQRPPIQPQQPPPQQHQQAQFANQIPAQQVYNELLGPDAFKDVILDIDYGALGGFNAAFQSGGDFSGGQLPPGINIRPAYTTVDSLNYQQHMFNTARTVNAGGASSGYDYGGASSGYDVHGGASAAYNVAGGQQFDAAKAIFNQADLNHDGSISRDEFRQWAQVAQPNYGGQAATNYQTSAASYGGNVNQSFSQAGLFANADPALASILQQSGLGHVVPN